MKLDEPLKQIAKELMSIKGNIRGEGILTDIEYIRYRKGEKEIKMLEDKLKELGQPINFDEISPMEWYPVGWDVFKTLCLKEVFNWSDKDIFEMANFAPKVSFLVKMLMKYFLSAERSFKESPKYWKQHFDFAELEPYQYNEKEKFMIFRVKDFKIHPIMCVVVAGYFLRMAQFVLKSKKVSIKETKCVFKGASCDEYLINWE